MAKQVAWPGFAPAQVRLGTQVVTVSGEAASVAAETASTATTTAPMSSLVRGAIRFVFRVPIRLPFRPTADAPRPDSRHCIPRRRVRQYQCDTNAIASLEGASS